MKGRNKENVVQAAIEAALNVYCQNEGLRLFPPYSNQQGESMRLYCADLVGLLDDSKVILLEIKELDCANKVFHAFDDEQYRGCCEFERLGVPIGYAYNNISNLEYHKSPRLRNWPEVTLSQINRAKPSKLPGRTPSILEHSSLLSWLEGDNGGNSTKLLGRIHGAISAPDQLRNGMLVLLYGVSQNTLAALTPESVKKIVGWLSKNSKLLPGHQTKLTEILGESSEVFKKFTANNRKKDSGYSIP